MLEREIEWHKEGAGKNRTLDDRDQSGEGLKTVSGLREIGLLSVSISSSSKCQLNLFLFDSLFDSKTHHHRLPPWALAMASIFENHWPPCQCGNGSCYYMFLILDLRENQNPNLIFVSFRQYNLVSFVKLINCVVVSPPKGIFVKKIYCLLLTTHFQQSMSFA